LPTLHVVLRSTAKENTKPRPPFFSKLACLLSLLRAGSEGGGGADMIFVNDGRVGGRLGELMAASGEIVEGSFDLRRSYTTAIDLVCSRPWPDDDLVYLCEDDHLHQPAALTALASAATSFPEYDYFGLYASVDARVPNGAPLPAGLPVPRRWRPSTADLVAADGHHWRRALSTTSTFAARVGALRADARIHRVGHRGRGHAGAHDHSICLAYQGFTPFPWGRPFRHVVAGGAAEPLGRRLKHGVWDLALDGLAVQARPRHHQLLGAAPSLACHVEVGYLASGVDWPSVASATEAWAQASGLT
jgi:hypothetical protein